MPRAGPRAVRKYSEEFKLTAVRLSQPPGLQVKTVAAALAIHPFMLSKWRKDARDGRLRGRAPKAAPPGPAREIARLQALEKAHALLLEEHDLLKKAIRFCSARKATRSPSSRAQCARYGVAALCRRFGVTPAGFYAWRRRGESAHAKQDRVLLQEIERPFGARHARYGSPRIHRLLVNAGWRASRRRVARLMRTAGLRAKAVRGYRAKANIHHQYARHPNRLWTTHADGPDQVWVGDITYLKVSRSWRYLAIGMDQYSRRILAWTLTRRRTAAVTCAVLAQAVRRRRPARGVIFHSDRGSEYMGAPFCARVARLGFLQSASVRGPGDNAHAESFFHSLKAELIRGASYPGERALRLPLQRYMHYYNTTRLHSGLNYTSPLAFERRAS